MKHIPQEQEHRINIATQNNDFAKKLKRDIPPLIEIQVNNTFIIRKKFKKQTKITLYNGTSNQAVHRYVLNKYKCAILNFANSDHPGGGYLNGSMAQEEELCRTIPELFLSLKQSKYSFNWWKIIKYNNSLKLHRLDNVQSNGQYTALKNSIDVAIITAAAPDLNHNIKQLNFFLSNMQLIFDEIKMLLRMCMLAPLYSSKILKNQEHINVLILGAFGCGAFSPRNDANNQIKQKYKMYYNECIAQIFCNILSTEHNLLTVYDEICFAIPDKNGLNYMAFDNIFNKNKLQYNKIDTINNLF